MKRRVPVILIVDDDKDTRETLSAILRSEGYQLTSAAHASEAIEKVRTQRFDLILIDIRLPDMEGTRLLSHFQKTAPETLKIMITGYPSVRNAAEALNIGADSYLTKPIDPDDLLKTIENKLQEREQKERITREKFTEWVRLRVRKTQSSEFEEFLERNATALTSFALNKTQAKIYVALNSLGIASASEIASLSRIRREEVYRTMPELEKRGLVMKKFGTPGRFAATVPRTALEVLTKTRIKAMKKEVRTFRQKKHGLISELEKASYAIEEENSIEQLSQQDNVLMRFVQMIKKAQHQITLATPFEQLEASFFRNIRKTLGTSSNQVQVCIVVGLSEHDECAPELWDEHSLSRLRLPRSEGDKIELRRVETVPFNLLMVDEKEAIWGDFQPEDSSRKILWTNDLTQIGILKMAFDNLWEASRRVDSILDVSTGQHIEGGTKESGKSALT
jgi:DNA-binding response OmpR family regulator